MIYVMISPFQCPFCDVTILTLNGLFYDVMISTFNNVPFPSIARILSSLFADVKVSYNVTAIGAMSANVDLVAIVFFLFLAIVAKVGLLEIVFSLPSAISTMSG